MRSSPLKVTQICPSADKGTCFRRSSQGAFAAAGFGKLSLARRVWKPPAFWPWCSDGGRARAGAAGAEAVWVPGAAPADAEGVVAEDASATACASAWSKPMAERQTAEARPPIRDAGLSRRGARRIAVFFKFPSRGQRGLSL